MVLLTYNQLKYSSGPPRPQQSLAFAAMKAVEVRVRELAEADAVKIGVAANKQLDTPSSSSQLGCRRR